MFEKKLVFLCIGCLTLSMALSREQVLPISPKHLNFKEYIDPGIRGIILPLAQFGYMVISSCEGHSYIKPRYITLAFTSEKERKKFITEISDGIGELLYTVKELETLRCETIDKKTYQYGSIQNEIKGYNYLFEKHEEFYCFVTITIGFGIHKVPMDSFLDIVLKLKKLFVFTANFLAREKVTKHFESNVVRICS